MNESRSATSPPSEGGVCYLSPPGDRPVRPPESVIELMVANQARFNWRVVKLTRRAAERAARGRLVRVSYSV